MLTPDDVALLLQGVQPPGAFGCCAVWNATTGELVLTVAVDVPAGTEVSFGVDVTNGVGGGPNLNEVTVEVVVKSGGV